MVPAVMDNMYFDKKNLKKYFFSDISIKSQQEKQKVWNRTDSLWQKPTFVAETEGV